MPPLFGTAPAEVVETPDTDDTEVNKCRRAWCDCVLKHGIHRHLYQARNSGNLIWRGIFTTEGTIYSVNGSLHQATSSTQAQFLLPALQGRFVNVEDRLRRSYRGDG